MPQDRVDKMGAEPGTATAFSHRISEFPSIGGNGFSAILKHEGHEVLRRGHKASQLKVGPRFLGAIRLRGPTVVAPTNCLKRKERYGRNVHRKETPQEVIATGGL